MRKKSDCSVIITNHNKPPEQLGGCVQSVLEQTLDPHEIILVDDRSDNPSMHKDAISILLPKNVGVAAARDQGVRFSTGNRILFVDADDMLPPEFLEACYEVDKDIAYPKLLMFGEVEQPYTRVQPVDITLEYLTGTRCQIPVTSLISRDLYNSLDGFRELPMWEDWDFWLRAFKAGYSFGQANTFIHYRQTRIGRNQQPIEIRKQTYEQIVGQEN